jgi:hypothetical protein
LASGEQGLEISGPPRGSSAFDDRRPWAADPPAWQPHAWDERVRTPVWQREEAEEQWRRQRRKRREKDVDEEEEEEEVEVENERRKQHQRKKARKIQLTHLFLKKSSN